MRRRVAAPAGDVGVPGWTAHSGSTSISGCFALTSDPLSGTTRTTRPARSDFISLNSFIASIRPITWPTATSPPTWTYGALPGADPYVREGSEVAVGQVIGLIEAMKLFNEIKSDAAGRVVRICVDDGGLVKAKQPLIELAPI
jgi:hypothetical protein